MVMWQISYLRSYSCYLWPSCTRLRKLQNRGVKEENMMLARLRNKTERLRTSKVSLRAETYLTSTACPLLK